MHELALMDSLVSTVSEEVGDARVLAVRLEIGKLAGVVPSAMSFCYDICTQGTALEGSTLEIDEVPGRARCRSCSTELEIEGLAPCSCGSIDLEILTGQELRIREVEVI